ncbi:ArsR/SmtB family transcription factor [Pengzhenrongella sicca]|uniref:Helix-turn-helix transcriptional regulator n=1 Tax=Pengzhenrongella sicca TaxID=2819238 RepID=A0A8A4ZB14_9MICO|nr:metalloregulator ArsR/SmtB family transcription factor [Pengzhenrongella sicca]QTE28209.1 helix-turn-helix transcriptional regulator [Pengzhenrongella sicca]
MISAVTIQPDPATLPALAAQFALLADPLRLLIVDSLAREQLCTCHLVELAGAKQTTISHHLRLLREAGVVLAESEGRFTWYRLAPGAFAAALTGLRGIGGAAGQTPRLRPACAT